MTMLVQGGLMVALTAVVGYGIWEIHRWGTLLGRETVSPKQRLLRVLGLFFLLLVLALWLRGTYLPTPHTRPALVHYLGYWLGTALAVLPLLPLALLDARENLHRALEDRRRLRENVLGERQERHE
jgi:hypothetical protein